MQQLFSSAPHEAASHSAHRGARSPQPGHRPRVLPCLMVLAIAGAAHGREPDSGPPITPDALLAALDAPGSTAVALSTAYWRDIARFEAHTHHAFEACRDAAFVESSRAYVARKRAMDAARTATDADAKADAADDRVHGFVRMGARRTKIPFEIPDTAHCDRRRQDVLVAWHGQRQAGLEDAVLAGISKRLASGVRPSDAICRVIGVWADALHRSWSMRRAEADLSRGLELYRLAERHCAGRPDALDTRLARGALLSAAGRHAAAIEAFESALDDATDPARRQRAARHASRAHQGLVEATLPILDTCPDSPTARPIPPALAGLTAAIERERRMAPDAGLGDVLYDEAKIHYDRCFLRESARKHVAMAEAYPDHRLRIFALQLALDAHHMLGDIDAMRALMKRFPEAVAH